MKKGAKKVVKRSIATIVIGIIVAGAGFQIRDTLLSTKCEVSGMTVIKNQPYV